ncbi:sensor protein ZraS [Escherichia coli]|nr:sensor protein ZraS [Escherichia coli]
MRFMQRSKDSLAKWLSAILPVVIVGLVGLFAVTVIRDYGRASEADRQALLEKGNVLIRALESGSRVGMGMRMHHVQQQALLEEMAGQPECCGSQSPMRRASLFFIATPIRSGVRSIRRMKCRN